MCLFSLYQWQLFLLVAAIFVRSRTHSDEQRQMRQMSKQNQPVNQVDRCGTKKKAVCPSLLFQTKGPFALRIPPAPPAPARRTSEASKRFSKNCSERRWGSLRGEQKLWFRKSMFNKRIARRWVIAKSIYIPNLGCWTMFRGCDCFLMCVLLSLC